ncbi:MAG TPA: hypothetical protein PLX07_01100 [Microthrixaceae bacterium]|nr:hypothetical protein [Microthrixaceae bacterium]HNE35564.1 hypothetical protein [Microthrixaceae bacterium]HNH37118.1 hypothetical protein [Microthrixaceae bacterium]
MRRALLPLWPALAARYGLHPWDVDRLTPDEINRFIADLTRTVDVEEW